MNGAIIVGGGAAGLLAAGALTAQGVPVVLFEKNRQLGRKVRITGKGRCNVTNHCTPQEEYVLPRRREESSCTQPYTLSHRKRSWPFLRAWAYP